MESSEFEAYVLASFGIVFWSIYDDISAFLRVSQKNTMNSVKHLGDKHPTVTQNPKDQSLAACPV